MEPVLRPQVGSAAALRARINNAAASVTAQTLENTWTLCELQMALTFRCTELELYLQVKQTNSLYLVHSAFCVYLKCGEYIVTTLYNALRLTRHVGTPPISVDSPSKA
jgi:hypothetical protein